MAHRYLPNKNPYRFYRPRIFACTKFAPVFHTVLHIYLWILVVTEPAASPNSVVHVQLRPNPLLIPIAKRKNHQYLRLEKRKVTWKDARVLLSHLLFFWSKLQLIRLAYK